VAMKGVPAMSQHEKEDGLNCLFSRQDMKLVNVRFFRGSSELISEEEFRCELRAAAARKRSGEVQPVPTPPRCKSPPIDLRAFVADM